MTYDYIIIGGGSAGCVLANRLSSNPAHSVCLIEAGGQDRSPLIHMPAGIAAILPTRHVNWAFNTRPQPGLNQRRGYQPRGKTLGGSSSINAMIYIRGHRGDYDDWARLGNRGWSYEEVLPYFKRSEDQLRGADDFHGSGGELTVTDYPTPNPVNQCFIDAVTGLGYPANDDFNGAEQEGVGLFQATIRDGQRCSAARAFLEPVKQRPNLTILTRAQTLKVLIKEHTAIGVTVRHRGIERHIYANKEVLLCAGAFGSPQLLMLSGIGPADEIKRHEIPLVKVLPGVGENLQDHPDYVTSHSSNSTRLLGYSLRGGIDAAKGLYHYIRHKQGILSSNLAESGAFLKTHPALDRPDIQLHFVHGIVDNHNRTRHWGHGFSCHVCLLRPKSRGRLTLASADPLKAPDIDPGFLQHPDDIDTLLKGFKLMRNILMQPSMAPIRGREHYTGQADTDEAICHWLKQRSDSIYHPVGTCKMGKDAMAVVDDHLRVHGINHLRVVDASVMPTLVGGNTNAPTIMIAEKAAALISAEVTAPSLTTT